MKKPTARAMNVIVAGAVCDNRRLGPVGITFWGPSLRMHSGHRCPTEASVEHAAQIGLPHLLQVSRVFRSGWR
jgi:hypothetical protein